jgi:hypothetical protein
MFCKHVLEFGSKLLRYLSFSGVHVRTGAGHYISELFTMPWGMLRLLLLVVNRSCPCDLIRRSPRRCLRLARGPGYIHYPDRYACWAQTNILAMEILLGKSSGLDPRGSLTPPGVSIAAPSPSHIQPLSLPR